MGIRHRMAISCARSIFLMVSGHQDAATINEAYARGVADFVLKPVNPALEITAQRPARSVELSP